MLKLKSKAPDFSLSDQNGNLRKLSDYKGKWVLVYFYPKDDTPGCTKEACSIRDNWPDFKKLDCVVLGISGDSAKSHVKFSSKYELPFTILSDENKEVIKKYGAWQKKKFPPASRAGMGREYMGIKRMSYLISPEGKIAKIYPEVKPEEHVEEVLEDIKSISK